MDKIVAIVLSIFAFFTIAIYNHNTIRKDGVITAINGECVTVDVAGEEFTFYGNGYHIGDWLHITFDKNGTKDVTDDKIDYAIKF